MMTLNGLIPSWLADAPNPADCPHHQCHYTSAASVGLVLVILLVVLLVAVVLVVVAVHRVRRRRRSRESAAWPPPTSPR
jgi:heme/copper-type cytochrome/quinol oxidase subunit 2